MFTSLEDGTAVLLNLNTLFYYTLNRTGAAIWKEIEERKKVELDDLLSLLTARYEVDEQSASTHLASFVGKLAEYGVAETRVESDTGASK